MSSKLERALDAVTVSTKPSADFTFVLDSLKLTVWCFGEDEDPLIQWVDDAHQHWGGDEAKKHR
jgi:hypothetical protein